MTTHTSAKLPVSPMVYGEIDSKLRAAGYSHAFDDGVIDMHGIALVVDVDADARVWWREDKVLTAMNAVLDEVAEAHGNAGKAVCWDILRKFEDKVRSYG